jgi:hypothetical protein
MAESLLQPDSSGRTPGGITAADAVIGTPAPGAGSVNGDPTANDSAPGNPTITGPGVTGSTPTGGGKAVPDNGAFERSDTIGDSDSMDDDSTLDGDRFSGNRGAQPPTPGDTNLGNAGRSTITGTDDDRSDDVGVPTGGLGSDFHDRA